MELQGQLSTRKKDQTSQRQPSAIPSTYSLPLQATTTILLASPPLPQCAPICALPPFAHTPPPTALLTPIPIPTAAATITKPIRIFTHSFARPLILHRSRAPTAQVPPQPQRCRSWRRSSFMARARTFRLCFVGHAAPSSRASSEARMSVVAEALGRASAPPFSSSEDAG